MQKQSFKQNKTKLKTHYKRHPELVSGSNKMPKRVRHDNYKTATHIMSISGFKFEDLYTSEELAHCKNRTQNLAGRLSAKIAIRKALQKEIPWKEINIVASKKGQPIVNLPNISVSIAHDGNYAGAFAGKNALVGIDITINKRVEELLNKKHANQILSRFLTPEEKEESKNDVQKLAKKWAGKEAVIKILGTGFWQGIFFQDIEILTKNNKPFIKLKGSAEKIAKEKNLKTWKISFQQKPEATFAFAVALS